MVAEHYTINDVMKELKAINSKLDNFLGFENITNEERLELLKIKKEMSDGKYNSYNDVFN